MSAIIGRVAFSPTPTAHADLAAMLPALAHCGPDGSQSWHKGEVALGYQAYHITPESLSDVQPWYDPTSGLVIVADARLDNRDDLCSALGIPAGDGANLPDSRLLLAAYARWGVACPEHLLGDFAFVIWDERHQHLFCCRDHLGQRPLFYAGDERRFLCASEAKGILAVPGVATQLNRRKLASLGSAAARALCHNETFYSGIYALAPATWLLVERQGLRQHTYWTPGPGALLPCRDDEVLEAFRALLFKAVHARLRSAFPVVSLLSGGLDSSSLVAVAAQCLGQQGKSLATLSAVLPENSNTSLTDERFYIDQFRGWPALVQHYITAPQRGPFDDLETLVWEAESPLASSRHYLYTAFAAAAHELGARVIINGDGGELGPTFSGDGYYAELFLHRHWYRLLREVVSRSYTTQTPPWAIARAHLLPYLLPASLRPRGTRRAASQSDLAYSFLQPAFVQQELPELGPAVTQGFPDHRYNQEQLQRGVQRKQTRLPAFVGHTRVEMAYPFLDKRLLEFCLAVPGALKVRNGYNRYLVRAGLAGLLPPLIQWRTTKSPFSPDYFERYNAQRAKAQALLGAIGPRDPVRTIVAVDTLKAWAAQDVSSTNPGAARILTLATVPGGLYTLAFLRQFPEFRP